MRLRPQKGHDMATRRKSRGSRRSATSRAPANPTDARHQIYLAGLGAASMARRDAPQLLEQLIAEGARLDTQTRAADGKALRRTFGDAHTNATTPGGKGRGRVPHALENLEKALQDRVHRALRQRGVPSPEAVAYRREGHEREPLLEALRR